jgi:hypothetical protein
MKRPCDHRARSPAAFAALPAAPFTMMNSINTSARPRFKPAAVSITRTLLHYGTMTYA